MMRFGVLILEENLKLLKIFKKSMLILLKDQ